MIFKSLEVGVIDISIPHFSDTYPAGAFYNNDDSSDTIFSIYHPYPIHIL
ncbi:hypothetical protein CHRY9390_02432 [Chryseobacterium aquaeductus]|uniref:Uncharacterized protein n=1 Tax=Chryseobacterium aquaeductus TaxID=2675056 RepID=A0A9N8MPV2_9FLAO|nr:hypothetical protein CHRY9390_02432 [Chryseobacterium potabilaquae]CAD7811887.1 hypothetical protein CHRY9390_02432 [Chryseobacterium aquaeductus]